MGDDAWWGTWVAIVCVAVPVYAWGAALRASWLDSFRAGLSPGERVAHGMMWPVTLTIWMGQQVSAGMRWIVCDFWPDYWRGARALRDKGGE